MADGYVHDDVGVMYTFRLYVEAGLGSRLTGLSDGAHPAVLFALDTKHAGLLDAVHGGNNDAGDLPHALDTQKRHLVLHEQRNASADEDGIAFEDVDIPEASSFAFSSRVEIGRASCRERV